MKQAFRVLTYIKEHGSITSFEAFRELGVTRLSARIFELREHGYMIIGTPKLDTNRFGEHQRYFVYTIGDRQC